MSEAQETPRLWLERKGQHFYLYREATAAEEKETGCKFLCYFFSEGWIGSTIRKKDLLSLLEIPAFQWRTM